MKTSQKDKVLKLLIENGKVTRNQCLRDFITTRLSAYILDFRKEGMNIKAEYKDGDFIYTLMDKPKYIEEFRVVGENIVIRKPVW